MSTFPTDIQYNFRIPNQSNKIRTRNKSHSHKDVRSQTILMCRWYDIIPKKSQIFH
jgi:hypothetical protein